MGNKYIKISMIIMLIGLLTLFFVGRKNNNVSLADVELQEENNNNSTFAIMLEEIDEEGNETYTQSASNTFPTNGYKLNEEKTSCIDMNGKKLDDNNIVTYENGNITVHTSGTSYCYLYFNQEENISKICNGSTIEDCMNSNKDNITSIANLNANQAGLYRYQGTRDEVDNNYICFGTDNKEDCIKEPDKYLYRILGITDNGQLKLIKNTPIKDGDTGDFQWHEELSVEYCDNVGENCTWSNSHLQEYLNTEFLNNEEYIPNNWKNNIIAHNWFYGDTSKDIAWTFLSQNIYDDELRWQNEMNHYVTAQIGLLYLSDVFSSYKQTDQIYDQFLNSWLHVSSQYQGEWVLNRLGNNGGTISGWVLFENNLETRGIDNYFSVRPVFYLTNTIHLSGLGTIDNPYLIKDV